jgi:hypothetical protein
VSGDHGNLLPVIETAVPVTTLKIFLAMPARIASADDRASRPFLKFTAHLLVAARPGEGRLT